MPAETRVDWRSAGQLVLGLMGLFFGLSGAAVLVLMALMPLVDGLVVDGAQAAGLMTLAWGGLLMAALSVPSVVLALRKLMGRPPLMRNARKSLLAASLFLLLWPLVLFLAKSAAGSTLAWLFLPPLLILVMGIPTLWLTSAARTGLPAESLQRGWGVANFGLVVSPLIIIVMQMAVLAVGGIAAGVWLAGQPELMLELQSLAETFSLDADPNRVLELLRPYLEQPGVLAAGMLFIAGLVPLIEELIKPLGVWFLAGRWLTPASGFSAGVLSGGMFALLESLGYLASAPAEGFVGFALARSGTLLLHITTAGLVGWGVGSALAEKSYLRLALTYLGAVLLHGAWNAVGILPALVEIPGMFAQLQVAAAAAPYVLGGLCVLLAVILFVLNRNLRKPTEVIEEV